MSSPVGTYLGLLKGNTHCVRSLLKHYQSFLKHGLSSEIRLYFIVIAQIPQRIKLTTIYFLSKFIPSQKKLGPETLSNPPRSAQ